MTHQSSIVRLAVSCISLAVVSGTSFLFPFSQFLSSSGLSSLFNPRSLSPDCHDLSRLLLSSESFLLYYITLLVVPFLPFDPTFFPLQSRTSSNFPGCPAHLSHQGAKKLYKTNMARRSHKQSCTTTSSPPFALFTYFKYLLRDPVYMFWVEFSIS